MANKNGKGPLGQGPLTGWGNGRCRRNSNIVKSEIIKTESEKTTLGFGKGGNPYGGGKGKCWGGGRNINKRNNI